MRNIYLHIANVESKQSLVSLLNLSKIRVALDLRLLL